MKHQLLLLVLFFLLIEGSAQHKKDSVLLHERAMDRPITLHGGQVRVSAGYAFSFFSKRLDDKGNIIHLTDEGVAKVQRDLSMEIKYGISEYVQLTTSIAHKRQSQRNQNIYVFAPPENTILIHTLTERKGLDDIYLAIDGRVPLKTRKFDIGAGFGATLPTGKAKENRPEHTIEALAEETSVRYHFNHRWGTGVPVLVWNARAKFRAKNWAFTMATEFRKPSGVSKGTTWKHQLYEYDFEYYQVGYSFRQPLQHAIQGEFEYQPFPWINCFLMVDRRSAKGGWTTISEKKTAVPDAQLTSLHTGVEIMVTPRLWLRQRIIFSSGGRNEFAPFTFNTLVNYNFFP